MTAFESLPAAYTICGGIQATVTDCTSHYFGGYYHVRIQVLADIPVSSDMFENTPQFDDAVVRLGSSVRFSRILEKMAIPENAITACQSELINAFEANVLPYLNRATFIKSFVGSEYRTSLKTKTSCFR
jgi:hypothetical protein